MSSKRNRQLGPVSFIEYVVMPEIAVSLIQEDMQVGWDEAREITEKSSKMGVTFFPDEGDQAYVG